MASHCAHSRRDSCRTAVLHIRGRCRYVCADTVFPGRMRDSVACRAGVLHSDLGRCRAVPADFAAWDRAFSTTSGSSAGFGGTGSCSIVTSSGPPRHFRHTPPRPGCVPVYPALWTHEKDRERYMAVFPDREPRARPDRKAKVRTAWNRRLRVCISYRISS